MITKHRKRKKELSKQLGVRLDLETMEDLEKLAAETERQLGELGRLAIKEYIARRKNGVAAA